MLAHDPFGRAGPSLAVLTREARVALLAAAAADLTAGRAIAGPAAQLLGAALTAWLRDGGDLERHLGVRAPAGSHRTPANLLRQITLEAIPCGPTISGPAVRFPASSRGEQPPDEPGTVAP